MATSGQSGQCPTCGNTIRIPILDRHGRLIDPATQKVLKPDPHPVHAYAAAGDRAPLIIRTDDGGQSIQCRRCKTLNSVSANSCRSCGVPFTLEGSTTPEKASGNGFATASLTLGIIGVPTCMIMIPSVLAIVFGVIALFQLSRRGQQSGRGVAIAGITFGSAAFLMMLLMYLD